MSITYSFEPESGILRTRCAGHVTLEDTLEHFRQVAEDPALPKRYKALLDIDQLTSVPATAQLRGALSGLDRILKDAVWDRWAIVAQSDVAFGMSRMFQVFLEDLGVPCRVFRDLDDAERWLASSDTETD